MTDLDELDRLHAEATAGPWSPDSRQHGTEMMCDFACSSTGSVVFDTLNADEREILTEDAYDGGVYYRDPLGSANISATVALHNAWPAISKELRALRAEVEAWRKAMPKCPGCSGVATRCDPDGYSDCFQCDECDCAYIDPDGNLAEFVDLPWAHLVRGKR